MSTTIVTFIALTLPFGFFLLLVWLPPELRRAVVHEALDHVGPDQSEPTEWPLLQYEQRQRRVEVGLLRQLLIGPNAGRGNRMMDGKRGEFL